MKTANRHHPKIGARMFLYSFGALWDVPNRSCTSWGKGGQTPTLPPPPLGQDGGGATSHGPDTGRVPSPSPPGRMGVATHPPASPPTHPPGHVPTSSGWGGSGVADERELYHFLFGWRRKGEGRGSPQRLHYTSPLKHWFRFVFLR